MRGLCPDCHTIHPTDESCPPSIPKNPLREIKVLDHGHVKLVDWMGSDTTIASAARVSYTIQSGYTWRGENDVNLLNYMMSHGHTSPFEHVTLTFEVKAPIFTFRQWHRHRTWSYNELSARYSALPEEFYTPDIEKIGVQSIHNKQGRYSPDGFPRDERIASLRSYGKHCTDAFILYRNLLSEGWPRELARCVLPVSTYSTMHATVNLHNLFKFLHLRLDSHAQWEIQEYARALYTLSKQVAPVAFVAWETQEALSKEQT